MSEKEEGIVPRELFVWPNDLVYAGTEGGSRVRPRFQFMDFTTIDTASFVVAKSEKRVKSTDGKSILSAELTSAATYVSRIATVSRDTRETQIRVELNLDGNGQSHVDTGLPFLDHMLDQVARHGFIDLVVAAKGDLQVDAHHTVEDIGISLGKAFSEALGDKSGIVRYGLAYVPLDEALSRVVIDCSGRPGLEWFVEFPRSRIGEFDVDLFREFFQGFANHAVFTMHIDSLRGRNAHHIAETVFKAFGRALGQACAREHRLGEAAPSTKGVL